MLLCKWHTVYRWHSAFEQKLDAGGSNPGCVISCFCTDLSYITEYHTFTRRRKDQACANTVAIATVIIQRDRSNNCAILSQKPPKKVRIFVTCTDVYTGTHMALTQFHVLWHGLIALTALIMWPPCYLYQVFALFQTEAAKRGEPHEHFTPNLMCNE